MLHTRSNVRKTHKISSSRIKSVVKEGQRMSPYPRAVSSSPLWPWLQRYCCGDSRSSCSRPSRPQPGGLGCEWWPLCPWGRCGGFWCGRHGPPQSKGWSRADPHTATPANHIWCGLIFKLLTWRRRVELRVEVQTKRRTLKDISTFSPPQISILSSYVPMCSKYVFEIEKRPPAKVGVLKCSEADQSFRHWFDSGWFERHQHDPSYFTG